MTPGRTVEMGELRRVEGDINRRNKVYGAVERGNFISFYEFG